jgi:hypothetical protein
MFKRALLALVLLSAAAIALDPGAAGAATAAPVADPAGGLAVATWGVNRLDVFARGTDSTLQHRIYNGRWSSWESLGGALTSAPAAVSWGVGRIDVVARGTNNQVVHRAFSNGGWSAWDDLGGTIIGGPAISSWGANRLDVVAIGTNKAMYHNAYTGTWSGWSSLGGTFNARPAITSWASGRIDVFGRGGGNALYHRSFASNAWSKDWENLGGTLTSAPAVTAWGANRLDIFAAQGTGLSHRYWAGSWSAWENLGGSVAGDPAVDSWAANRLDIMYPGPNSTLMHKAWNGAWTTPEDLTAVAPVVPTVSYTPISVLQGPPTEAQTASPIEYAWVNNSGQIIWGYQPQPDNFSSVQWTTVSGLEKFTGQPMLAQPADGRLRISAQNASSDIWTLAQKSAGSSVWNPFTLDGGSLAGHPTLGRLSDGSTVVFAVGADGALWALPSTGIWKNLGDINLTGTPGVVATRDGLQIFGLDTAGDLHTAAYSAAGTLSGWTDLGGSGLNGTPAVVVYPGYLMRVFVRSSDGHIVTKAQDATGVYPADWTTVGDLVTAGAPSALLSPSTALTEIVVRGTDGFVWNTGETAQASGQWRPWVPTNSPAASDPTAFAFNDGSRMRWVWAYVTADEQPTIGFSG